MPDPAPAVETKRLFKWFGGYPALKGIDLNVAPGEILSLFGSNGAGKTTLLRILAGRSRATSGTVRIAGLEVGKDGNSSRGAVGTLAHGHQLYEALTARENLDFAAAMLGLDRPGERVAQVLSRVGLEAAAGSSVRTFSSGMKRRLALAKLMLREPTVILLDEPFASLDLQAVKLLEEFLMASKIRGAAAILATHNLTMGFGVADRLAILRQGRLVFEARREETSLEAFRALFALHSESGEVE
jgi:heme ABC exporter ATP-binding subunit CcmA